MKMDADCEETVCKIYQNVDGKWSLKEPRFVQPFAKTRMTICGQGAQMNSKSLGDDHQPGDRTCPP